MKVSQPTLSVEHKIPSLRQQNMQKCPEISALFKALSDDKSLMIFNTVAMSPGDSSVLVQNLNLTRKQYYSKMNSLTKQGLLIRKNGKYHLTTMGKIIYELQSIAGVAVNNYWKLKAIDSLQTPENLPKHELIKLITTLVEDPELREIILRTK